MDSIYVKYLKFCPLIQSIVLISGTLVCLIIAAIKGDVSLYVPFISETGAYSPEKNIFSFVLMFGSFIGSISYFSVFLIIRKTELGSMRYGKINVGSLVVGLSSLAGLAGVAAFPMTSVFWVHLGFAGIYFSGSCLYFIIICFLTFKIYGETPLFKFRSRLCFILAVLLFLLIIIFPIGLKRWQENNVVIPALKTPEETGFTLLLLSAILEWSIVLVIIALTLSIVKDLKNFELHVTVLMPETDKNTAVIEGSAVPDK